MRRDLHWWIGGALLMIALPMLLWQALGEDRALQANRETQQAKRESAQIRPPETTSALERTIDDQVRQAQLPVVPPLPPLPPLLPRTPPVASPGGSAASLSPLLLRPPGAGAGEAGRQEPASASLSDAEASRAQQLAAEEERRVAVARSSPLLAIGRGGAGSPFSAPDGDGEGLAQARSLPISDGGRFPGPPAPVPASASASASAPGPSPAPAMRAAPDGPVILEGTVIPAVLLTAINSDLPGTLVAQVTQDIWDSVDGRYLLIPRGARLVGDYNSDIRPGQERVLAAFRRLILPDGSSIDLLGTPATDAQGRSGLHDRVDRHFGEMFGASFIVAGLASLVQRREAQPATVIVVPGSAPAASSALASAAGAVLVDTSRAILGRTRNIPPTLLIRQGHRFSLTVQRTFLLVPEDAGRIAEVSR